ncbi:hypothetical protein GCM10011611_23550 [Aliidongia dinghuensis]|uniref:Uncharacterized protein n=1 Tax=Aliidongia dinghuensis TaxID=1867774 RepID=A0A8J3E210_9PROT|nr:hypothetical protein [Aliidongia dinghuensis]GGF17084.1 hypothetical protein GCM10011611_23550 [Aliidongia dinghuensis]
MRWLKAAVIIMGVMIVAMLVTIVVTIFRRMSAPRPAAPVAVEAPAVPGTPAQADVTLPAGFSLRQVTAAGGRIVLHLAAADGRESLMLIDPTTGKVALTIALHTAP